jgi:hypothetical protein
MQWLLHPHPEIGTLQWVSPIIVAFVLIALCSLLREPTRREFSAVFVGGAGAAYLGSGLGPLELIFCAIMTYIAFRGLRDYRWIALAWVLHTCWDVVHHLYADPILPFAPLSSFGCSICDLVLAAWYWVGAPSPWVRAKSRIG